MHWSTYTLIIKSNPCNFEHVFPIKYSAREIKDMWRQYGLGLGLSTQSGHCAPLHYTCELIKDILLLIWSENQE